MKTKMPVRERLAFTLIELLVVIAIIMLLAAIMSPVINNAMRKAQMVQTLNNGKQIYLGMFSQQLERRNAYPKTTGPDAFANSTDYWKWAVTNRVLDADFSMFSAHGLLTYRGLDPTRFTPDHNAWCIVGDLTETVRSVAPLLFTRNLEIATLQELPAAKLGEAMPFGSRGVVTIKVGGDGNIYDRQALEEAFNPSSETNAILRP